MKICKRLPDKDLPDLLNGWMEQTTVYAPVRQESFLAFQPLTDPCQADLTSRTIPRYPAKALFLPQSEVMFKVCQEGRFASHEESEESSRRKQRLILGIRPCDLRAIQVLDDVFLTGKNPDPYWARKRETTTMVALGCHLPGPECFCTSVGTGPFDSCGASGADVMLTRLDNGYTAEVYTQKGQILFESLAEATSSHIQAVREIQSSASAKVAKPFTTQGITDRLYALFESDFWDKVQKSCLGCGACTFLCPTCHCFDIVDETQRRERVRNWDSCMFRIYSQEASGYNPRPGVKERLRQRIMHKFAYLPQRIQKTGCTGCGRCVRFCPVNLDIRAVIRAIIRLGRREDYPLLCLDHSTKPVAGGEGAGK